MGFIKKERTKIMKKTVSTLLLLLSSTFVLASCGNENASTSEVQQSISLSQTSLTLEQYQSATLECKLNNISGAITWTSSDLEIATVNNGVVNAKNSGNCTITASIGSLKAECAITVVKLAQAPRLVMADTTISLDKDQTYSFDAYVLYKNEKIDSLLEFSLKEGEEDNIVSLSFANGKIIAKGLAYGETSYIVHTKALGINLSASLNVKVSNSSLSLSIDNIEMNEEGYRLNLAAYKVEDGYDTEFTPKVIFKENNQDATYPLTYTSSDENIAAWENGKIIAKKDGQATLKIECEEFAVKVEIHVQVYKGAYRVTLKNTKADGTDDVQMLAPGKMPANPVLEGRKFAGWYSLDGERVSEIIDDMTLVARWKTQIEGFVGDTIYTFDVDNNELYGTPEGVEKKWNARGMNEVKNDITQSWGYGAIYEDGSFVGLPNPNSFEGTVGVTFPAYDFSNSEPLTFSFGLSTGHDGNEAGKNSPFMVNGNSVGTDINIKMAYTAKIDGNNVSVYNKSEEKTYSFNLEDEVYHGQKGLNITCQNTQYRFFLCTPYKSLLVDYISKCESIEEEVPDSPINDADSIALVKEYQELRTLYTDTENSLYPMSEKMSNWIDALPKTVLRFEDNGRSLTTTGNLACSDSWINKAYTQNGLGRNVPFSLGEGYLIAGTDDLTKTYGSVTLPAFDFSAYKNVTFSFGQGGNGGGTKARYFLGSVDNATSYEDSLNLPNYLGEATSTNTIGWNLAEDIKATISNGKITFKGNESTIDKTLDLDNDIYTGQKGLTLTLSNVTWEFFVLSPFTASNI